MSTGVYCGVGRHDSCMLPSCRCGCHTSGTGPTHLVASLPPRAEPPRAPLVDEDGQRVCACCGQAYEKRAGPGRYPTCHPECLVA